MNPQLDACMWDLEIQGKTAIIVAVDGVVRGVLGLADTAKSEAYSTIRALYALKIDVWMVSCCFWSCVVCSVCIWCMHGVYLVLCVVLFVSVSSCFQCVTVVFPISCDSHF